MPMHDYRIIVEARDEDDASHVTEVRAEHASKIDMAAHLAGLDEGRYYTDAYRIEALSQCVAGASYLVRWRQPNGVIGGSEARL